jgi:hypothetical protein
LNADAGAIPNGDFAAEEPQILLAKDFLNIVTDRQPQFAVYMLLIRELIALASTCMNHQLAMRRSAFRKIRISSTAKYRRLTFRGPKSD